MRIDVLGWISGRLKQGCEDDLEAAMYCSRVTTGALLVVSAILTLD